MPFQTPRNSREIELSETFPWFAVCTWMGRTREVAGEHWVSVPDEHVARAIAGEIGEVGGDEAAQSVHAELRRTPQDGGGEHQGMASCGPKKKVATPRDYTEPQPIPPRGVEPLSPG
jgi:hypothetical protein